jgi:hypothetical protein
MQLLRFNVFRFACGLFYVAVSIIIIIIIISGVGLSPLGTGATNWPTVPASDDRLMVIVEQLVEII